MAMANEVANPPNRVKFLLNWNRFHEHLANSMSRLMVDSTYSDVIIATGDRRMIYGHRFVLANSSKYFYRLLKQMNRQRGVQLVVALPEVKYDVLKVLMNYMYRGETQVGYDLLPTVIKAGRMLEINGLVHLNDADKIAAGARLLQQQNNEENQPSHPVLRPAREEQEQESRAEAKPRARVGASRVAAKRQVRRPVAENESSEYAASIPQANAPVRRFRPILPKDESVAQTDNTETINLPVKRKYTRREPEKEAPKYPPPSATVTTATLPPAQPDDPIIQIKRERLEDAWQIENPPAQEVTIKTEFPFEIDEMNNIHFEELYCDVCKEGYSTHTEWVRHSSHQKDEQLPHMEQMQQMQQLEQIEQMRQMQQMHHMRQIEQMEQMEQMDEMEHTARIQQIEQTDDQDEPEDPEEVEELDDPDEPDEPELIEETETGVGTETVYNCVICSEAMYSASEWIQHIRVWHTDAEPLNKGATRRIGRDRDPRIYK